MATNKDKEELLFDVRSVKRNIAKGYITEKQQKSKLDALEDISEKGEVMETEQRETIGVMQDKRDLVEANRKAREAEREARAAEKKL